MAVTAERQEQVEHIWRDSFQTELNDALRSELREAALVGVKSCLEQALKEELNEHLGFGHYERSSGQSKPPEAQRSGYFRRRVNTDHGTIPDLRVPKLRRGNKEREWKILTRYQSSLQYLLNGLLYIYVMGLSIRDLQEAMMVMWGPLLSVSAINRVTTSVQAEITARQQQPLTKTPPIIIVDGVWVKILYPTGQDWVDKAGHTRQARQVQERVILVALAVWPDGTYHILHYEIATDENEETWKAFWQHLIERGLDPYTVELVVSDGTNGLLPAMAKYLPKAKQQRCTVHKIRGLERYLQYNNLPQIDPETGQPLSQSEAKLLRRRQITTDAHHIFKASTLEEALQRLDKFEAKWNLIEPRAVQNFKWGLRRCFEFYRFNCDLHRLIRSTTFLERFFREFRAKADEIGSFPNEESCLTIFHLVMIRDHAKHNRLGNRQA